MEGENKACEYLMDNGFTVLGRNLRRIYGEIDIICRAKDGTLVFVEVKTLRSLRNLDNLNNEDYLVPEDNLTSAKLMKLKKICLAVANEHAELLEDTGWRVDLLALTKERECFQIKHYENIA